MSATLGRILPGFFLLAVSAAVSAAPFALPADKNPPFRRDRLPIGSEAMISLSKQLTLLTQGGGLETAEERRSAAQALALALALDPSNNGARKCLSALVEGKRLERPKQESFDAAKGRVWQVLAWLSMPQAGSDGNALSHLIRDSISVLDRDHPDAGGPKGQGMWEGWVAPLSAFEEEKLAKVDAPDETDLERPSETADPKVAVVLEKADLKTVLHTYDNVSGRWSFGLVTVRMEASPKSPDPEPDQEEGVKEMKRKEFEILVPDPSFDDGRVERMVANPIKDALLDYRGELPDQGQIKLLVGRGNYSFQKDRSQLTGPGFILANAALSGIEPQGTVIAELDENQKLSVPQYFWKQVSALSEQQVGRVIIPAAAEKYLIDLLILREPEFFLNNEILMASSNGEFVELCAKEPSEKNAAVFSKFEAIATKAEGNPIGPYLSKSFVRQRLEEIASEAPYHLSAKLLSSIRPQFLSREVLAAEIWRITEPLNELTDLDLENNKGTARFESLYEDMQEGFDSLERYAELGDRELVNEAKGLAAKIRSFIRILRGRGELEERYEEIYSARRGVMKKNHDLRQLLSEAGGELLPEDGERNRRVPMGKRD